MISHPYQELDVALGKVNLDTEVVLQEVVDSMVVMDGANGGRLINSHILVSARLLIFDSNLIFPSLESCSSSNGLQWNADFSSFPLRKTVGQLRTYPTAVRHCVVD